MKKAIAALMMSMAMVVACAILAGCEQICGASEQKLTALRRGMTYEETSQIMGCSGVVTAGMRADHTGYGAVEYDGPRDYIFTRTRLDFMDGRLLSYTTEKRGAL